MKNNVAKKTKPNFEEFLEKIDSIITEPLAKKKLNSVLACLRHGYDGKIANEQIESISNKFFGWGQFPFITLKIALLVSCGPCQTDLMKRVSRKMREECGRRANFPFEKAPLFTNVSDPKRKDILEDWVSSSLYKHKSEDAYEWARLAVICMLNEELTEDDYEIISGIARSLDKKRAPCKKQGNKFAKYVSEICAPFNKLKIGINKLAKLFEITSFFEDRNAALIKQLRNLEIELEDLQEKINDHEERLVVAAEKLQLAEEETKSLKQELDLKSGQLRIEAEKLESSEKYWKHELERRLSGIVSTIKKEILHEVNEAKLSIDNDRPDLEMALSRLKNIDEDLRRFEAKWRKA